MQSSSTAKLSRSSASNSVSRPSGLGKLIDTLGRFFASESVEAYLVGGVVRDLLLGRSGGDVDVAVAGGAQSIGGRLASSLGGRLVTLDPDRGFVRVVVPGPDAPTHVDVVVMNVGIAEDLARRDLTVDAMALRLSETGGLSSLESVIDPFGGREDLRGGVIRAVSPAVFKDDPARLMRAPRLAAQLRFTVDEETVGRIRRDAHLVSTVAPERIRDELLKLLAQPGAASRLRQLDDLDLLCRVFPELAEARGVTQPKEHYWDVFEHLIETVGQVERVLEAPSTTDEGFVAGMVPPFEGMREYFDQEASDGHTRAVLVKLAGLMHDVSKPATRTVESSGRIRFLGHHTEGAEVAGRILRRLRFSGRGVELMRLMVGHHLRPGQMSQKGELPTGRAIYRYFRDVGDAALDTLYLNLSDYLAARGPYLQPREWEDYCRVVGYILSEGLERKAPQALPKLISGHDIMESFRLSPGPQVGKLVDVVREAQANGEVGSKEDALALVKATLDAGGGGA